MGVNFEVLSAKLNIDATAWAAGLAKGVGALDSFVQSTTKGANALAQAMTQGMKTASSAMNSFVQTATKGSQNVANAMATGIRAGSSAINSFLLSASKSTATIMESMAKSVAIGVKSSSSALGSFLQDSSKATARIMDSTTRGVKGMASGIKSMTGAASIGMRTAGIDISGSMDKIMNAANAATKVVVSSGAAIVTALAGIGAASLSSSTEFEKTMARVGALTDASADEFGRLRRAAIDSGGEEAAEAMKLMAQSGSNANSILLALPPTMKLAKAGAIEIGQAVDITSRLMTGMGLDALDLSHAVDVMTKAFTTSDTDVTQLSQALRIVGPIAKTTGRSMEDVVMALQAMASGGLQGAQAGSALRAILTTLSTGTKKSSEALSQLGVKTRETDGSMRKLPDIIHDLERAFERAGPRIDKTGVLIQAFGNKAGPGMVALVDAGAERVRKYAETLEGAAGTADRIISRQSDTLAVSMGKLRKEFTMLQLDLGARLTPIMRVAIDHVKEFVKENGKYLELGLVKGLRIARDGWAELTSVMKPLLDALRPVGDMVKEMGTKFIEFFDGLPPGVQSVLLAVTAFGGLGKALEVLGGHVPFLGTLITKIGGLINPMTLLSKVGGVLATVFGAIFTPAGLVIAAIAGIGASIYAAITTTEKGAASWAKIKDMALQAWDVIQGAAVKAFNALGIAGEGLDGVLLTVAQTIGNFLLDGIVAVAEALPGLVRNGVEWATQAFDYMRGVVETVWEWLKKVGDIASWLGDVFMGAVNVAIAEFNKFLEKNRAGLEDIWEAVERVGEAIKETFERHLEDVEALWNLLAEGASEVIPGVIEAIQVLAQSMIQVFGVALNVAFDKLSELIEVSRAIVEAFEGDFRRLEYLALQYSLKIMEIMVGVWNSIAEEWNKVAPEFMQMGKMDSSVVDDMRAYGEALKEELDRESRMRQGKRDEERKARKKEADDKRAMAKAERDMERAMEEADRDMARQAREQQRDEAKEAKQQKVKNAAGERAFADMGEQDPEDKKALDRLAQDEAEFQAQEELNKARAVKPGALQSLERGSKSSDVRAAIREETKNRQDDLGEAFRGKATKAQMKYLAELRDNELNAIRAIQGTKDEERDAAIENAKEQARAFEFAFDEIKEKGKEAFKDLAKNSKDAADDAVKNAKDMHKDINDELDDMEKEDDKRAERRKKKKKKKKEKEEAEAEAAAEAKENEPDLNTAAGRAARRNAGMGGDGSMGSLIGGAIGSFMGGLAGLGRSVISNSVDISALPPEVQKQLKREEAQNALQQTTMNRDIVRKGIGMSGVMSLSEQLANLQALDDKISGLNTFLANLDKMTFTQAGASGGEFGIQPTETISRNGDVIINNTFTQKYTTREVDDLIQQMEASLKRKGKDPTERSAMRRPRSRRPYSSRNH